MKLFHTESIIEVGVDEAGRGPLFGRVYAAAVVWPPDLESPLIKDSKDSMFKRKGQMEISFKFIQEHAIAYGIGYSDETVIKEKNILQATMDAMHQAIRQCNVKIDQILVDGNYFRIYSDSNGDPVNYVTVIKGDSTYYSIAAASILAKYSRDQYIVELCRQYPELDSRYGLLKNKGYGTAFHIEAIKKHGITQFHRTQFGICKIVPLNSLNCS